MSDYDCCKSQSLTPVVKAGTFGALVGATGAAAANIRKLRNEEIERADAIRDTVKIGLTAGAATVAGKLVADTLTRSPALALVAMFAAGTATAYWLQGQSQGESETQEALPDE